MQHLRRHPPLVLVLAVVAIAEAVVEVIVAEQAVPLHLRKALQQLGPPPVVVATVVVAEVIAAEAELRHLLVRPPERLRPLCPQLRLEPRQQHLPQAVAVIEAVVEAVLLRRRLYAGRVRASPLWVPCPERRRRVDGAGGRQPCRKIF